MLRVVKKPAILTGFYIKQKRFYKMNESYSSSLILVSVLSAVLVTPSPALEMS